VHLKLERSGIERKIKEGITITSDILFFLALFLLCCVHYEPRKLIKWMTKEWPGW